MDAKLQALVSRLMKETPNFMNSLIGAYDPDFDADGMWLKNGAADALNELVANRGYDPHLIQDEMSEWDDLYSGNLSPSVSSFAALRDTFRSAKESDGDPIRPRLFANSGTGFPSIDYGHPPMEWAESVEELPPAMQSATALAPDSDEVSELFALLDKNKRRREQDMPY
jgi:hypothetical protein